jgi:hypothetical protein
MEQTISHISTIFDVVITCLLAATIFFAIKLSRHLDSFRSNRASMESLIRELSAQITRAQEGISVLDELSANRGDELRTTISKAQALSDELQLMTQSANSLAERLETMAVRNRTLIDEMDQKALGLVFPSGAATQSRPVPPLTAVKTPRYEETLAKANVKQKDESELDSFFSIRDPDFEDEDDGGDDGHFASKAEKDLADALKRRIPKGK